MKRISIFLFFLLLVFVSLPVLALVPNDLVVQGLLGNVKSIEEETTLVKEKNGISKEEGRFKSRIAKFDENGRITYDWVKFTKTYSPTETFYYYENEKRFQRKVISNLTFTDKPREFNSYSVFKFESAANSLFIDEYTEFFRTGKTKFGGTKYTFDNNGRLIEEIKTIDKTSIKINYLYENKEFLPYESQINFDGNKESKKFSYELDPQGNWIKRTAKSTNDNVVERIEITYRKLNYYN